MLKDTDWVLVTDTSRGVGYGRLTEGSLRVVNMAILEGREVQTVGLYEFRHCFEFGTTEGIGELAAHGPGKGAKIGPPMELFVATDVSKIIVVSAAAVARFKEAKWSR